MRRWCGAAICAVSVFLILPVSHVAAHAAFIDSNPVDGSVIARSPPVAELRFTEPVLISASSVRLLHLGSGTEDDLVLTTDGSGTTVLASVPKLPRGAYILRYVVVDPADLHKTVGSISFGIGVAAPPSQAGEQVTSSWLSIMLRAITDAALLLAAGAIVLGVVMGRNGRRDFGDVGYLVVVSSSVVAIGWIGQLAADAVTVGFDNVQWGSLLLKSDPGRRALVGVELAVGVRWTVRLLRRATSHSVQRFLIRILAVIASAFVVAAAYGGHAGIGGSFLVGVMLRALHLGSLCIWIGAVAALWLVAKRDHLLREFWPSVSSLAAVGLALTGATGLLLSGRVVVTVTALLSTTYGQRIVIKAGLLVVLAVLGMFATRRVIRARDPRHLPLELGVAGCAIVIAALLASSAPARGEQFLAAPTTRPQVVTSDLLDLTVSASVEPARPGPNLVQVRVLDTRRPAPGPVENVTFRIIGGDGSVAAERQGIPDSGVLEWADVSIPNPGLYRVEVDVARPAVPVPPFIASWDIDPAQVPRVDPVVSTRSWAPFAAILAGGWLMLVCVGWWATRYLGRSARSTLNVPLGR